MLQQGESEFSRRSFLILKSLKCWMVVLSDKPVDCHLPAPVKDKAEILLQVEELLHIKEELSSQVSWSGVRREERECARLCDFIVIPCGVGDVTTRCSGTRAL